MDSNGTLADVLLAWEGVSSQPHRYGGIEFRVAGKEIGHLHGEQLFDAPLPRAERDAWIAAGKAEPHHIYPDSGWVSVYLRTKEDEAHAAEIARANYERLRKGETEA
ncbi:luciferase family protein [Paenibacillus sp. GCM10023250]|uniref:luciferase domain-containing protein n=1 Tax=Paenibacillus sp. GCM10023250 TaxID=3252648 RepID=UPI00360DFACC